MSARIVIVHDELEFRETALAALRAAGHEVLALPAGMAALDAVEAPEPIDLLITRVTFPAGDINGVALARMAKMKRPGLKILFAAREENRHYTEGIGEFLPAPMTAEELANAAERILKSDPS